MKTKLNTVKAGFSLVEMLVVIAVIGIIAAIAVPMIGNITAQAQESRDKRNAQNVVSVYAAAAAAGATFNDVTDIPTILSDLGTGVPGAEDTGLDGTIFQVPNLDPDGGVQDWLDLDNGQLVYKGSL